MQKILINILKFLLFVGVGGFILYFVYQNQNAAYQEECGLRGIPAEDCSLLQKIIQDFADTNYFWIGMVLLVYVISNISRAIRWQMIIKPLGYQTRFYNAFLAVFLTYFGNLGFPRLGEIIRAGAISRYERVPMEKVVGTVVVDRALDVISILLLTALMFALEYDKIYAFFNEQVDLDAKFGGLGNMLMWMSLIGVALLGLIIAFRKTLLKTKLVQKIVDLALGFWEGIKAVKDIEKPGLFIFHSINIWAMYYLMTYLCFFAFEPTAGLAPVVALVVFVSGGWGMVIPSPGGMGTYHALATGALAMYGVSGNDGFSWANISFFSIQLGCNVLIGLFAVIALPILNRNYHPQHIEPSSSTEA